MHVVFPGTRVRDHAGDQRGVDLLPRARGDRLPLLRGDRLPLTQGLTVARGDRLPLTQG